MKEQISKKHWRVRYRKFKGCFGNPIPFRTEDKKLIHMPRIISLTPDENASMLFDCINHAFDYPNRVVDFRKVERVTIRGGIVLKAFYEEYYVREKRKLSFLPPKDRKMKAVLQFLGYADYGISYSEYDDIECWDIRSWDKKDSFENVSVPQQIMEEVIPKCCGEGRGLDEASKKLTEAVTEAIHNAEEHAYIGSKKDVVFQKWYLGCGEYLNEGRITFCVYDRGCGFKESMLREPTLWENTFQRFNSDYQYIKRATEGTSGTKDKGRGQGLKSAVEILKNAGGNIEILSGRGLFSSVKPVRSQDRKTFIDGTVIAFYVPVKYIERG